MVTPGAIVSPAIQIAQLGALLGIMILVCALVFRKGLNLAEYKSGKFEKASQEEVQVLVKDGIVHKPGFRPFFAVAVTASITGGPGYRFHSLSGKWYPLLPARFCNHQAKGFPHHLLPLSAVMSLFTGIGNICF